MLRNFFSLIILLALLFALALPALAHMEGVDTNLLALVQSPDGLVETPSTKTLVNFSTPVADFGPMTPAAAQPVGALSGRIVFMNAGHGWTYDPAFSPPWRLLRPSPLIEMNEDYGNVDQLSFLAAYCFNAGATVVAFRPLNHQTNEVVLDQDSPSVTFAGTWNISTNQPYFGTAGDSVSYQYASFAATETATAAYTPSIPQAGFYPVYTWVRHGTDRGDQLYRIKHTGGESQVRIPHHMVGNGWIYLGEYYFNQGSNSLNGAVVISNLRSTAQGTYAFADGIRFGNGMGSINRGGGVSDYPREDENCRYWVQAGIGVGQTNTLYDGGSGTSDESDSWNTPPRMSAEMNNNSIVTNMFKRVHIGFHSNATTGNTNTATARGTTALIEANSPTPNQSRLAKLCVTEVENDLIALGTNVPSPLEFPWHSRSAQTTSGGYTELNNSLFNSEMDATIVEVAFHDNVQDAPLLRDSKVRATVAKGVLHGILRYMNEFDANPLVYLPEPPANVRATGAVNGDINLKWAIPVSTGGSGAPTNYVIYRSTNGYGFGNPISVGNITNYTITNLAPNVDYYFQVAAANAGGQSFPSGVVGCRAVTTNAPKILCVTAFDRFDRTTNLRQDTTRQNWDPPGSSGIIERIWPRSVNAFNYVVPYGKSIAAHGMAFDTCQNEAITNGLIALTNYPIVIWESGQELTNTFNSTIQSRITNFLGSGRSLFVSGSEIAGNLDRASGPSAADRAFFNNYFHADLSSDANTNSGSYTVSAVAGSIFAGNGNATFDNGSKGIYWVKSPSVLTPFGSGATAAINYTGGLGGAAGIQYDGSAGGGRVVYFGFPFETISTASDRNAYLADVLNFLSPSLPVITTQPQSLSVNAGSNATFTAAATGATPLTYQWIFNGSNISGATNTSYTRTNVQVATAGNYSVVVTNSAGSVTSAVAVLSLNVAPSITAQPQNQTVAQGASAIFSVTASGTTPLSYQWRKAGVNLSDGGNVLGTTSASLTLLNVTASDATNYSVVVTNVAGSVTSSNAALTVTPPPGTRTLNLPPRAANAPNGTEFINIITSLSLTDRENMIYAQIAQGNVPNFMRTLVAVTTNSTISGTNHTVTYYVTPDYLAVGTDADYFLEPMTPILGQRISDLLNCSMPTRKMVDNIWTAATVKLAPSTIAPSAEMTTVPVFADHNTTVRGQRNANGTPLGALVGGDKKDVIISTNIYNNPSPLRVVIYGWHQLNGSPIQPRYNGHEETYADYSHGIRLVDNSIMVDGVTNTIAQILGHSTLSALLSDEGVISVPRYPLSPSAPIILTQPYSQTVAASSNATFTATIFGDAPLTYIWKRNGVAVSGATSLTLSISNVQPANVGTYTLTVSNGIGSATSIPVLLKIEGTEPVLFSDNFDSDTSSDWNLFQGSANGVPDYTADWAFDYGATRYTFNGVSYLIPPAPNSTGGATKGIKLTVNDNDATAAISGVNIYPKNFAVSNNFVLQCDVWLNYPGGVGGTGAGVAGSTEHAILGINHLGTQVNWAATTAASTDGLWFGVDGEGGSGGRDYRAFRGNLSGVQTELIGSSASGLSESNFSATVYQNLFPSSRFESPGVPGKNWVAMEMGQSNGIIFWKLDGTTIAQRANTAAFTSGNVMLGLMDTFSSIASPAADSFVIFDNVRVKDLGGVTQPPTIVLQPQNQTVNQGADANFSVTASGAAPLSFQWRFGGSDIAGATTSNYTRANSQSSHAGNYLVVVTNGSGSITSSIATLAVIVPPTISVQPTNQSVNFGATVTMNVSASGTALTYQWSRGGENLINGGNISGATTPTLTLGSVTQAEAGTYNVVVSNAAAFVISADANLTVIDPVILTQPISRTNNPGTVATFSVTANGTASLNFQWTKDGTNLLDGGNISGATTSTLMLTSVTLLDTGIYSAIVANNENSIVSSNASLSVGSVYAPVWTQFPGSPSGTTRNDDIFFADLANGWSARGTNGVYRTTDGGQTWIKVITNTVAKIAHFRSIGFASATRGWTGNLGPGSYDGAVNDTNLLYETFDGGANWSVVPGINGSGMQGFCAMHVLDSQHIYGVGRVRGPAYFAKTENGGTNWSVNNVTNSAGIVVMGGLMDVYFKDTTNGFAVGMDTNAYNACVAPYYHGAIARTTNGGRDWFTVASTTVNCSYFWKMSWPSANVGYASLQQNGSYSTVIFYKTTNGGTTWSSNGIPLSAIGASSFGLQGIGFVSETEGWMGGSSTMNAPTNFIHTIDGGLTWTAEGYNNTKSINRIRFVSPTLGYMSGQTLHVYRSPLGISQQPQNQNAVAGSTVNFSIIAEGNPAFGYQWQKAGINLSNGGNVSGATASTLMLANVSQSDATNYSVVVTNAAGSMTSLAAILTVIDPPMIISQPTSQTNNAETTAIFTVVASGSEPLSYQWKKGDVDMADAEDIYGTTSAALTLTSVSPGDATNYSVVITNGAGVATSSQVWLTVNVAPTISTQPQNQNTNVGGSATFSVVANGTAPLSYQWKFSNANISGATSSSYTKINLQLSDAGNYSVLVTNMAGSVLSSNAVLTVTSSDITKPSVSVSRPANNSHTNVTTVTMTGTAKDTAPGVIVDVKYRLLPETSFASAALSITNGQTNWTTPILTLKPGTNVAHIYSVDGGGNNSALKTNTFYYDSTNLLMVKIQGDGQVRTNTTTVVTDNQAIPLLVGRPFALTAFIGVGTNYVFTNWMGGTNLDNLSHVSANPAYSFVMQSNLILQANFIPNPFTPVAGTYSGLFHDTNNGVAHRNAGFFTVKLTAKASYTGSLIFDGDKVSISGKFDLSGRTSRSVSRATKGKTNVNLFLELDWSTPSQQIRGTLTDGNWISTLLGDKAIFNLTNPATEFVGAYTFLVPRNLSGQSPAGFGYGLVTNNSLGIVALNGALGDGAPLSQKVSVSKDGLWPLYVQLYKTTNTITNLTTEMPVTNKSNYRGSLLGWVTFTNQTPGGTVHWIKTGEAATNYFYPLGFTNIVDLNGSPYHPPSIGMRALNITNGTATFSGGNLSGPIAWNVNWASNNLISATVGGSNKPVFTFTTRSGLLKGTYPQLGRTNFAGAVLQNQNYSGGFFLGTNQSGSFLLQKD